MATFNGLIWFRNKFGVLYSSHKESFNHGIKIKLLIDQISSASLSPNNIWLIFSSFVKSIKIKLTTSSRASVAAIDHKLELVCSEF